MVSIYKCDYCGADQSEEMKAQVSCGGSINIMRVDGLDLCGNCQKEIREMLRDIIKRRKALGDL